MKAIVYEKSNAPEVLVLREVEKPIPGEDEVLVKVCAVSINAADYRSMRMGIIPKRKIFGADVAGRVEAVGRNTNKFKVGDEVFGELAGNGFGGFAEFVCAPERFWVLKPAGVSFIDAAAIPMAGLTALQGLRDLGGIQAGQKVLICGAGGGVGTFAVQLARYYGADVTAVCGPGNVERIRALGANRVIDYTKTDFTAEDEHYDLILAVNGSQSISEYKRVMARQGKLVVAGGALTQIINVMLFGWLHSISGSKVCMLAANTNPGDLEFLINLLQEGKIKPVIDKTYPLDQTPDAMKYLSQGHARGKVVIDLGCA